MAHLLNKIQSITPEISLRNRRLQECRASCFSLCKRGDETGLMPIALAHGSLSLPSFTYSFCSIHDRYHCIQHKNGGLLQPLCGECAIIYYAGHFDATPMVEEDQRSVWCAPRTRHHSPMSFGGLSSSFSPLSGSSTASPRESSHEHPHMDYSAFSHGSSHTEPDVTRSSGDSQHSSVQHPHGGHPTSSSTSEPLEPVIEGSASMPAGSLDAENDSFSPVPTGRDTHSLSESFITAAHGTPDDVTSDVAATIRRRSSDPAPWRHSSPPPSGETGERRFSTVSEFPGSPQPSVHGASPDVGAAGGSMPVEASSGPDGSSGMAGPNVEPHTASDYDGLPVPPQQANPVIMAVPFRPQQAAQVFLGYVPRNDPTYTLLSSDPINHPHMTGVKLLPYANARGFPMHMPVGSDMKIFSLFNPLGRILHEESPGVADPVMLEARMWACAMQNNWFLPKDLRWVLVMVFEVSCRALRIGCGNRPAPPACPRHERDWQGASSAQRPSWRDEHAHEAKETERWAMRSLLHELYDVFSGLCEVYHMCHLHVPEVD